MYVKKTVNIVGGGIGSLVCGAYLIKMGFRVKIFEKLHRPGGVVGSFYRRGYFFEPSTRNFSNPACINRLYRLLELDDRPSLREDSTLYELFYVKREGVKSRYLLPTGLTPLRRMLVDSFPAEKKGIEEFFRLAAQAGDRHRRTRMASLREGGLSPLLEKAAALLGGRGENSLINSYGEKSFSSLLDELNFSSELKSLLSQYSIELLKSPDELPALQIPAMVDTFARYNPYHFSKGSSSFINRLSDYIEDEGGHIYLKNGIDEIRIKDGKVDCLVDLKGREHRADLYVSTICPDRAIESCGDRSKFIIFIGLPFSLESYGFKSESVIFNYTRDMNSPQLKKSTPSAKSNLIMRNFSAFNKSPQKSSLVLSEQDSFKNWERVKYRSDEYKNLKKEIQNRILDKFEAISSIPVRERAEVIFSASPLTNSFYIPSFNREVSAESFNSPLENLFMTDEHFEEGKGLTAVISSGIETARRVISAAKS